MVQQQHPYSAPAATSNAPAPAAPVERELPMLAGIGTFVTWCEDLLNILSGPVITAGLAIALVALLTDGDLLVRVPAMLYIWAGSMALGLDAQFVGSAAKLARALRQRRYWAAGGYVILCGALGYVGYIASNVFATQEANGITTVEALQRLGMDGSTWIVQRSALAVFLVFLSGALRYVAPGKNVAASSAEEAERLRAEIELEPLRAQLRAEKLRGMRGAVMTGLGRDGREQPPVASRPAFRAAYEAPEVQPQEHAIEGYRAAHDGYDDYATYLTDEVIDELDDEDGDLFSTMKIPALRADGGVISQPSTNSAKKKARSASDSGSRASTNDRAQGVRNANKQMRREDKLRRRNLIRDTVYDILDEWRASGTPQKLSDSYLAKEVGRRAHLEVFPSENTVSRWRGPWQSSRTHKAQQQQQEQTSVREFEEALI